MVAVGRGIMANATSADYSVGIGNLSLYSLTSGRYNVAVGYGAGHNLTTGVGNVFIGHGSGYHETGSNKLYIENSDSSSPLIGGDFATDEVTINGSLFIKDGTEGAGKIFVSDANGKGHWEEQSKQLLLGSLNATVAYPFLRDHLVTTPYFGAYIDDSSIIATIMIPINLPVNAVISKVRVYYKDNTTDNYKIQLLKNNANYTFLNSLGIYTTNGSGSNVRYHDFVINETVTSPYQYYLSMQPESGNHWAGDKNSALKGIIVYYTE